MQRRLDLQSGACPLKWLICAKRLGGIELIDERLGRL